MKADGLLDAATAHAAAFAWLRATLAPASPYGDVLFAQLIPFAPGREREARERAERIARIAAALDDERFDAVRALLQNTPDAAPALARASMGDTLGDAGLLEVQRFFDACVQLDALTSECVDLPPVANEAVRTCAAALERGRAGKFGFYLDDAFDLSLGRARAHLAQAQAEYDAAHGRARAAVALALDREISLPEFIVMREDLRGPLPMGVRVVREAPTYVLCELDADDNVLAALRRRDDAAAEVARVEEAVRDQLSATLREQAAALDAAMRAVGEADVLIAAARFVRAQQCAVADYDGAGLSFEKGRFVPLALELAAQGRAFTPIDLELDGIAVVTGPNMGGKSACLRACAFISICAAFGLPVPAVRARLRLFASVAWLGIGDGEDGDGSLLSSFAREIVRLRELLTQTAPQRLVLLDEFARTTTPSEGKALLVAVLERLRADGVRALAATHLAGVAQAAGARHYAVRGLHGIPQRPAQEDLAQALESLAASMDYTLEEIQGDRARGSDAIALASLLGIDDGVIDAAYRALGSPE